MALINGIEAINSVHRQSDGSRKDVACNVPTDLNKNPLAICNKHLENW